MHIVLSIALTTGLYASALQASYSVWSNPSTATLFAPGIFASSKQAEKYFFEVQLPSGLWMPSKHGNTIINGRYCLSCNFAEIMLPGCHMPSSEGIVRNLVGSLINTFVQQRDSRFAALCIDMLSDDESRSYKLCLSRLNFGQERDIAFLSATYDELVNDPNMPTDIVLYGFSRGAAAAFNFMATCYNNKQVKRIRAIVLEACYDNIAHLMPSPFSVLLETILPAYTRKGIAPGKKQVLKQFVLLCNTYAIPVIFISSKADKVVPHNNVKRLCMRIKQAGLNQLYFLTLNHASHAGYLFDSKNDRARYHYCLHAFYRRYGLSHIPALADKGEKLLDKCCISSPFAQTAINRTKRSSRFAK
jgi:hypothetical protein